MKNVLIVLGVLMAGAIGYWYWRRSKNGYPVTVGNAVYGVSQAPMPNADDSDAHPGGGISMTSSALISSEAPTPVYTRTASAPSSAPAAAPVSRSAPPPVSVTPATANTRAVYRAAPTQNGNPADAVPAPTGPWVAAPVAPPTVATRTRAKASW